MSVWFLLLIIMEVFSETGALLDLPEAAPDPSIGEGSVFIPVCPGRFCD